MANPPLSLVPESMNVHYWNVLGHRVVKIEFVHAVTLGSSSALHMQEFGEALIYPTQPPKKRSNRSSHVVGLDELCRWLQAQGFTEAQQGEIIVGVCEAYIRSLYPNADFDSSDS